MVLAGRTVFWCGFIFLLTLQVCSAQPSKSADTFEYVINGKVDMASATNVSRVADCSLSAASRTLAAEMGGISEQTSELEMRLAQFGAFATKPATPKPSIDQETVRRFLAAGVAPDAPNGLRSAVATAREAVGAIAEADAILAYPIEDRMPRTLVTRKQNLESSRKDFILRLVEVVDKWKLRSLYRDDLSRRGVRLDSAFFESCVGAGFWKIVSSLETSGGEQSEMWDSVNRECEGNGALDSAAYVALFKSDIKTGVDEETGCTFEKILNDSPVKIVTQSQCPISDITVAPLTQTVEQLADDKVHFQSRYDLPGNEVVALDQIKQLCAE